MSKHTIIVYVYSYTSLSCLNHPCLVLPPNKFFCEFFIYSPALGPVNLSLIQVAMSCILLCLPRNKNAVKLGLSLTVLFWTRNKRLDKGGPRPREEGVSLIQHV